MRASDRARDQTAANLSRAAAQGQLSIDTLTWRLERTFQAKNVELAFGAQRFYLPFS